LDPVIRKHVGTLSENMLEKELCRLIEPYSFVQIAHIARMVELPVNKVEKKLAQMILDKKFSGSLGQDADTLIVYDDVAENKGYDVAIKTIQAFNKFLDLLYERAHLIK